VRRIGTATIRPTNPNSRNYHHAVACYRAFRRHGIVLAAWRIHRHTGMGGDHLVAALTDEHTDQELGD